MTIKNKTYLDKLLKKFNSGFVIHEFHSEWNAFLGTLSKTERSLAVEALMNSMLDNAKTFRQEAVTFAEKGTEEDRQAVLEMAHELTEHPFFTRKSLVA